MKRMDAARPLFAFFSFFLLMSSTTFGQEENSCMKDAATYCKEIAPGGGRVIRCLMNHFNELTPECRDFLLRLASAQDKGTPKTPSVSPGDEKQAPVPQEYLKIYSALEKTLNDYDTRLNSLSNGKKYPVVFGAELLPANCNRGKALLQPQAIQGVILYLDRLKELGVQGVTIPIHYPLYTPNFPGYDGYVAYYKEVAREVRKRDMKLDVESHVIFANTSFSDLSLSYTGLTFEKFKAEKRQMVAAIIRDVQPDYLNLGAEPDTEAVLTGLKEFSDPKKYTDYLNDILDGLSRGSTKIIAGIGTWGNLEYVRSFAKNTSVDAIGIHVYPVIGKGLDNTLAIADIARQYGKSLVLDEAWLYKSDRYIGHDNTAWSELFRRDVFSFWAPLDRQFLAAMVKFARTQGVEYVSPFWTGCFFAYVDYDKSNSNLPYKELSAIQNQSAASNLLKGKFTSTGEFYKTLIQINTNSK